MPESKVTCPMTCEQVVEAYFMEHRAKLIDIAAFLDRLDRTPGSPGTPDKRNSDFRMNAFHRALDILRDGESHRAKRILELMSDHSTEPVDKAPMKGALGAVPLDTD